MRIPVLIALLFSFFSSTRLLHATDPQGLAYTPEGGWAGSDGVIYLLESETNEIYRWNSAARAYLPSIPLPEPCLPIAVHSPRGPDAATSTFLITAASGRVLQFYVSGSSAVAAADLALQTPGVEIQGLALIGSVPDILVAYRDAAGQKVQAITATGYSSVVSVAADTVESDWVGALSGSVHRVISRQSRAGTAGVVARTLNGQSITTSTIGLSGADIDSRIVAGSGSEFLLASGVRKLGPDTASMEPVTGAAYYGRVLMTLRGAPGGSQLARYPLISLSDSAQLTHATVVPGVPWGAFTVADRAVAVTLIGGVPAFHVADLAFQLANQLPLDLPVATGTRLHRAVDLGGIASLTGSFISSLPTTYAWKKDGVILPDETSDTLTISQAGSADSAVYTAVGTNVLGSAETEIILQAGPARGPGSPPANTLLVGGGPQLWQESSPLTLTPFPAFPLDVLPGPGRVILDSGIDRWGRLHLFSAMQAGGRVTANTLFQSSYYPAADRWVHRRLSIPLTLVPSGNMEASILGNNVIFGRSLINLETGALRLISGTAASSGGVPRTAFTLSQWMQDQQPLESFAPVYSLGVSPVPSPLLGGTVNLLTPGSIQLRSIVLESPFPVPTAGAITSLTGDTFVYDLILGSAAGIMIYTAVPPVELGLPLATPEFFIDSASWGLGQTLTDITVAQPRTFYVGVAGGTPQLAIVRYNVDQGFPEFVFLPEPVLEPYTSWTGTPQEIPFALSLPQDPAAFRVFTGSPFRIAGFFTSDADPRPSAVWTPEQVPAWLSVQISNGEAIFSGTPSGPAGQTVVRGTLTHPSGTKTSVSFTIEVLPNTAPVPVSPELSLNRLEDASDLLIAVQELFIDAQTASGELSFTLEEIELPAGMTAVLSENSGSDQIVFKTSANQHGAATLRLSATDPQGLTGSMLVRIQTSPVNDRPSAVPGSAATDEDTVTGITLTGTDVDGDALTYTVSTPTQHGTLSGTAPNLTYTPAANYHGPDSFEFTVSDGTLTSEPAAMALTVRSVNDRPSAVPGNAATDEDTATGITLTGTDVDGDALTYIVSTPPQHGTLSGTTPNLTYTPAANYHGQDGFEFTVSDGTLTSEPASIALTVRPVNDRPSAVPGSAATDEDTATGITLTGTDVDGDALTYIVSTPPQHGTLSGTAPNLTYTPAANYHGPDSFEFTVSDGTLTSASAVVELGILPVPDAPQAVGSVPEQIAPAAGDLQLAVGSLFADGDGDPLQFSISGNTNRGVVAGAAVDSAGTLRIAFADYSQGGLSVVTVRATDPSGRFAEQQIRITLPPPAEPTVRVVQTLKVNRQTGLLEFVADVTNIHTRSIGGLKASFAALPATVCLYNGSDCLGGSPESVYARPLMAGETVRVVYQFYAPSRNTAWTPQLTVTQLPAQPAAAAGGGIAIDRCLMLPGGALLLEFPSVPGALYQVEFLDPGADWLPVPMQMRAAGTRLQWIDHGPPATPALPAGGKSRFYRVRAL